MRIRQAFKAAFPHTIPVLTGYLFFGMAFGILLQDKGYGVLWAAFLCVTIYAGSMQFVAAGLLATVFSPINALFVTLMVNARHIFYGFSMLEKYRDMGRAKPYLIFSLTDETFSLLCSTEPPEGVSRRDFYLCVSLLDQLYWIAGGIAGALLGSVLPMAVKGIEFVMTALFVSIFTEQWRQKDNRIPALIGLGGSVLCLLLLGPERFLLPSMAVMVAALTFCRRPLEAREEVQP